MEQEAERHGINLREYLVLTGLGTAGQRTQLALGQALGLDKTTVTTLLDRLEEVGLLVRRADPDDRRARIPDVTEARRVLQSRVAREMARVETGLLSGFSSEERHSLRSMLCQLITGSEGSETSVTGSCV